MNPTQTAAREHSLPTLIALAAWHGVQFVLRWTWLPVRNVAVRLLDLVLNRVNGRQAHNPEDFRADAEWSIRENQVRGARAMLWISLVSIIALLVWAAMGNIDEVVRGEGKIVPSRQVQVVQSLDGGIVQEILAREGQSVEPGQALLRIDSTRFTSSLGENRAEFLALRAKAARLDALANDRPFVVPEGMEAEAPVLIQAERRVLETRTTELNATISIAREQLRQREQELRGVEATRNQAATSCELTSRELDVTTPLLASGAVSEVDLLRLRRDVARSCGEQKTAAAQINRIGAAIQEARTKISEAELNIRNTARNELSDIRAKLAGVTESQVALADRVKLADIRSPVRGTVKTLFANTVGGVVQPGKDIIEIVPTDDTLLLEVKILPRDIGFLRPGQTAEVKFTAYDFAIYGGLEGKIEHIGADTITDDKNNSYYVVRVRTERASLGKDQLLPIIPGMLADVHVQTGKRTLLQYLLKPVLRAKSNALTER